MNTETTKCDWSELKGKIKARFGKLTEESIDSAKGNLDLLTSKLQSAYGYAKDQAEKELLGFKATLHAETAAEKKTTMDSEKRPAGVEEKKTSQDPASKKVA